MLTCHFGTANIFAGFWIRACWICAKYAKINVPRIFPLLQYSSYTVRLKKVYTFSKSPQLNFTKYSYLWIAFGLFFQMRPNNLMIFHAWVSRRYFCEREQNPVLTGFDKILALACISKVESHERLRNIVIFWCFYDNLWKSRLVACMFWWMPSIFMFDWAIRSLYWARILVNFTNVAPAHSSIQYRQILKNIIW